MSATELVCAAPSQQRLRRSSVAAALRAASAPSQQHQLCRGRDAQNERDGAGLRSSVAAATPSQLRRSSAARTMSGRRGRAAPSKIIEQPVWKICHLLGKKAERWATIKPSSFKILNLNYRNRVAQFGPKGQESRTSWALHFPSNYD